MEQEDPAVTALRMQATAQYVDRLAVEDDELARSLGVNVNPRTISAQEAGYLNQVAKGVWIAWCCRSKVCSDGR